MIRENVDYQLYGSNYKKVLKNIVEDVSKLMFCGSGYQCIGCTYVPLNQTTEIEHNNSDENCEGATSDKQTLSHL